MFAVQDRREYSAESKEVPPPWWEQIYFGLPLWAWVIIAAGGTVIVGGAAYALARR